MRLFSCFLISTLVATSVAQREFFASSKEAESYEFPASGEDLWSSEEVPAASMSKVDPPYGSNFWLAQKDNEEWVTYDFMGMHFPNSLDLSRHLAVQTFRKACTEADLEENGPQKCYDCVEEIADVTINVFDDFLKYGVRNVIEKCSKRHLKKNNKFGTCHRLITDEILTPNNDDQFMTMQHTSPEAIKLSRSGRIFKQPVISWSWLFPMVNFYRCVHSQSVKEHKGNCGGDKSCISQLFDQSMTTSVKRPRTAKTTPLEQRVEGYNEELQHAELAKHNELRARHGVAPLELDDDLIVFAQNWANHLAQYKKYNHNYVGTAEMSYGENLALFGGKYNPSKYGIPTHIWYDEIKNYNFNNPQFRGSESYNSKTMNAHFTQVVWKNTRRVGFGISTLPGGQNIVVANYDPAGNSNVEKQESLRANVMPLL